MKRLLEQVTPTNRARLSLKRAPPEATCDQCGHRFQLDGPLLECEKCGSLRLKVEESAEAYVDSITFEEDNTMSKETLIQMLRPAEFLRGFGSDLVEQIARISKLHSYKKNEALFDEDQAADNLYLIVSGKVLLEVCTVETGCKPILTVGRGELLGWSSLTNDRKYTARAVALEPVEVIQIDGCQMRTICDSDPRFGYEFLRWAMSALAKRLSETWRQLGNLQLPHYIPFAMSSVSENQ
jgi:CRP-like cAMP-binding protein